MYQTTEICSTYYKGRLIIFIFYTVITPTTSDIIGNDIADGFIFPPLGHAVNYLHILIARETQVHKILTIETLCRFLKKCDLLAVVFDKLVILL